MAAALAGGKARKKVGLMRHDIFCFQNNNFNPYNLNLIRVEVEQGKDQREVELQNFIR